MELKRQLCEPVHIFKRPFPATGCNCQSNREKNCQPEDFKKGANSQGQGFVKSGVPSVPERSCRPHGTARRERGAQAPTNPAGPFELLPWYGNTGHPFD